MVKIEDEKKDEQVESEKDKNESATTHDPYFAPIVNLPEMDVSIENKYFLEPSRVTPQFVIFFRFQREKKRREKSSKYVSLNSQIFINRFCLIHL